MVLWKGIVEAPELQMQRIPDEETRLVILPNSQSRPKSKSKLAKGILVIFGCVLMFSISNAVQKYGDHKLTFWQLLLYRGIGQTIVLLIAHSLTSPSPCQPARPRTEEEHIILSQFGINGTHDFYHFIFGNKPARSRVILQGFLGGVLLFGLYGSIHYIPLASATAILFSTPLFTFLLAVCMLRESCKAYRIIVSLAMILGVILITKPGHSEVVLNHKTEKDNSTAIVPDQDAKSSEIVNGSIYISNVSSSLTQLPDNYNENDIAILTLGYFIAILAPMSTALMTIVTRQAVILGEERVNLMMLWHAFGLLLIVGIAYITKIADGVPFHNSSKDYGYAFLNIITGAAGNYLLCMSSLYMSPSLANVFRGGEVIIAYVLQVQFENAQVTAGSLMGIFLLLTTAVMISFEEKLARKFHYLGMLF